LIAIGVLAIPLAAHEHPPLIAEQIKAISPVVKALANALQDLGGRYPELEGVDAVKIIVTSGAHLGVAFSRNFTPPREKRGVRADDWGEHGIHLYFSCVRPEVADGEHEHASEELAPWAELKHLGLEVYCKVIVGPDASKRVRDEVLTAFEKHVEMLKKVDILRHGEAAEAQPVQLPRRLPADLDLDGEGKRKIARDFGRKALEALEKNEYRRARRYAEQAQRYDPDGIEGKKLLENLDQMAREVLTNASLALQKGQEEEARRWLLKLRELAPKGVRPSYLDRRLDKLETGQQPPSAEASRGHP